MIPRHVIDEIIKNSNIDEIVGRFIVLKKGWGLCPFHDDTKPSFSINSRKQIFKCFACGIGGNVVTFLMKYEGISFMEAISYLAGAQGINLISYIKSPKVQNKISSIKDRRNKVIYFIVAQLSLIKAYKSQITQTDKTDKYGMTPSIRRLTLMRRYLRLGIEAHGFKPDPLIIYGEIPQIYTHTKWEGLEDGESILDYLIKTKNIELEILDTFIKSKIK